MKESSLARFFVGMLAEVRARMNQKQWPSTIDEAVGVVIAALSDDERVRIAAMSKSDLIGQHMGLGLWIINNVGLWQSNAPLMEDACGRDRSIRHPDSVSTMITETVWERLREMVPNVN